MAKGREFDVVVYGSTGFTGRLVAEYLNTRYGVGGDVKWAMAGRSEDKLAAVRDEMGIPKDVPFVVADADDPASLMAMAERTSVVLTTVGPYQLYGEGLVKACAEAGTDYVDLCGEPAWMRGMIDKYGATAEKSGARIVFSCGFDSIPFDLGVLFAQEEAKKKLGGTAARVKTRVRAMNGTFSGGTLASFKATMAAAGKDPKVLELLASPYCLTPGFEGPEQPAANKPAEDAELGWQAPFIMAPINTKNVHRTNALLGHPYGKDFVYDEMMLARQGEEGRKMAEFLAGMESAMANDPKKPGEGPSKEERENGNYDVLIIAEGSDGKSARVSVKGDRDPGYGSTSKIIAESAVCLVKDVPQGPGGITTPGAAMGMKLVDRLQKNAGVTFRAE